MSSPARTKTMASLIQIPLNFLECNAPHISLIRKPNSFINGLKSLKGSNFPTLSRLKAAPFADGLAILEVRRGKIGQFLKKESWKEKKRVVLVRFNGLPSGGRGGSGGGGGGIDDENRTVGVLTNLALAIVLAYLTLTGKLGWILDAILSIWILAGLLPIIGIVAFIWWASREILQGTCPNCGSDVQVFKSALDEDDRSLCPSCSQPFSVVGDAFVKDPSNFSNQPTSFGQATNDFTSRSKKGKKSSAVVVDVEAEVKDAE
ncbi:hypothetical protein DM860_008652 [Cuscuta australis]|uniref:Uncharacterized protein n=1 Tax=Cuscuta australis TaxID=267555 RepID=A0A328D6A7_9ASTE|nr:hypothetical protein DM860_008652 [Cuscuta australis]